MIAIVSSLTLGTLLIFKYKNRIAIPFTIAWTYFGGYVAFIGLSLPGLIPFPINDVLTTLKNAYVIQVCFLFGALAMRFRSIEFESIRAKSENKSKSDLLTRVSHEIRHYSTCNGQTRYKNT